MQVINALVKTQHKAPYAICDLSSMILPSRAHDPQDPSLVSV